MAQTDQRSAGITTSTHKISVGFLASEQTGRISNNRSYLRGLSSSPPPLRLSKAFNEYAEQNERVPQRQHSWIIRRQPSRSDSGICGAGYVINTSDAHNAASAGANKNGNNSNSNHTHLSASGDLFPTRSHIDVERSERSIHTVALTGPTKAVSILIGGPVNSGLPQSANPNEGIRVTRDSLRPVPIALSPRSPHGLGITVDNQNSSISISSAASSGGTGSLQLAVRPACNSPSVVRPSLAPVTVGVSATGTVVLSRVSDISQPAVRQRLITTPFFNVARVQRRNSTATCLPPRPRFEIEPVQHATRNGSTLVRISSAPGRGLVVTASSASGLKFQTPSRVIRFASPPPPPPTASQQLRPSGSCDSLLSDRLVSGLAVADQPVRGLTQTHRHTVTRTNSTVASVVASIDEFGSSVPRPPESVIVLRDNTVTTLNCDMPNVPPSTVNVGTAKANCAPQPRASVSTSRTAFVNEPMSRERAIPFTDASSNLITHVSPVTVTPPSTAHKPLPPSLSGRSNPAEAHGRHKTTAAKQSQYFRVQIPCTRAAARSKGFVVTDSLKLYEDQILNYCQAAQQRPQSWCIDFGALNDELTLIDDSNSGSPASTVSSSYSSSSSSDASQSPSFYSKAGPKQPTQHSKPGKSLGFVDIILETRLRLDRNYSTASSS
ncbi:hypothetical protein FBUS_00553 [Fasciolopsis buskii]|uniref:Uncharacterized protein n=1 Tax=Fasciolopsis buskii TaxID=27845 RepID=A0A8E0RUA3_9TREM|nr:hypothetical protein FBUS_00553 [Fasciolopsis buski]